METGIRDKVAIIGMGCSKFGERWDAGGMELIAEAFDEALADAGIERKEIEAGWFGCCVDAINVGGSAVPAAMALRIGGIPFTRVENMCATGTEALAVPPTRWPPAVWILPWRWMPRSSRMRAMAGCLRPSAAI